MRHDEIKTISSIGDFITKIDAQKNGSELLWYRGHADIDWKLIPSLYRNPSGGTYEIDHALRRESAQIKKFRQVGARFLRSTNPTEWDLMLEMQHYEVPTRLLDWSENPLVALYFAVSDNNYTKKDAALWVKAPGKWNAQQNLKSDSILTNDLPCLDYADATLEGYAPGKVKQPGSPPIAVISPQTSPRIIAQSGVFTLFHADSTPLEAMSNDKNGHIWKLKIPAADKPRITSELEILSINKFTVFPEFHNVSERIKSLLSHE